MNKINLIVLENQGFCFGVTRAIKLCEDNLNSFKKPIYLLGDLVHNKNVSNYFENLGVTILKGNSRLEMLDKVTSGTVIITAHGVGSNIYDKIKSKGLDLFDCTCPFVKKASDLILEYINNSYDIIYIGKNNHPETEGVISESNRIHLIENINDVDNLNINNHLIGLSNQTTMPIYDIEDIVNRVKEKYPNVVILKTICNATKNRQKELSDCLTNLKEQEFLCIVIGDPTSNNTLMLEKRAKSFKNGLTIKIESKDMLDLDLVNKYKNIVITSGASTPHVIVNEVIDKIKSLN